MTKPNFRRETEDIEWLYDDRDEIEATWKPVLDKNGKPLTPAEIRERELLKRRQLFASVETLERLASDRESGSGGDAEFEKRVEQAVANVIRRRGLST